MATAKPITPRSLSKPNPDDAELIAMIERHDFLWTEWGRSEENDPRIREWSEECCALEDKIVATRANTRKGLRAKWRLICETGYVGKDGCDTGDLHNLVAMILQMDVDAIGASIPALEAEGITAARS